LDRVTKIANEICKEDSSDHAADASCTTGIKRKLDKVNSPFPMPQPGSADAFDRTQLLLNFEQMVFEHIPLPPELEEKNKSSKPECSGFVASKVRWAPSVCVFAQPIFSRTNGSNSTEVLFHKLLFSTMVVIKRFTLLLLTCSRLML
uniref:PPP1R35_C domain-containing protein n=1 Tax=Echinostoma caproni TaxID=27848 RepID=A0A183A2T6_9TREM